MREVLLAGVASSPVTPQGGAVYMKTNEKLLCPVHFRLEENDQLEPFDNCIACIRNQRDELIELLKRISTDIAQTIIEDPIRAADGWVMMSQPVLKDVQAALAEGRG